MKNRSRTSCPEVGAKRMLGGALFTLSPVRRLSRSGHRSVPLRVREHQVSDQARKRRPQPAAAASFRRFTWKSSVRGADLHGLHAGLGFGPGLEGAVVDDRGGGRRRFGVNDGALLGRCVAHDVNFLRTCGLRDRGGDKGQCADNQDFFQGFLRWVS